MRTRGSDGIWRGGRRLLSTWAILLNGSAPEPLGAARIGADACRIVLVAPALRTGSDGAVAGDDLHLTISRRIDADGVSEAITIGNHGNHPVRLIVEMRLSEPTASPLWSDGPGTLTIGNGSHGLVIGPTAGAVAPMWRDGMLAYVADVPEGRSWRTALRYTVLRPQPPRRRPSRRGIAATEPQVWTSHAGFQGMVRRAMSTLSDGAGDLVTAISAVPLLPTFGRALLGDADDEPAFRLILLAQLWRRTGGNGLGDLLARAETWLARLADESDAGVAGAEAFAAWVGMARVFGAVGQAKRGRLLRARALRLRQTFDVLTRPERLARHVPTPDADKCADGLIEPRLGLLLWSGVLPPARVPAIVRHMFEPDLWTGWGVRSLSAIHPDYNPLVADRGAVSPAENGLMALGLARHGLDAAVSRITAGLLAAAERSTSGSLPSLLAGFDQDDVPFPVRAPGTGWHSSDGVALTLLRAMLRLEIASPTVSLRPALPDWLPNLTMTGLQVGSEVVEVQVWRDNLATRAVLRNGKLTSLQVGEPPGPP